MTASAAKSVSTDTKPAKLSNELQLLEQEVIRVLPSHVGVEKFIRVVTTALKSNMALARADRMSLFGAAVKCAQDGLLPDGREAAFVVFKTKDKSTGRFVEKVQYMPMVYGIIKKIRNSGELKDLIANPVMDRDDFRHWVDDAGEHITHEPSLEANRGHVRAAYAIARMKDGGVFTRVLSVGDIEKARACSKTPNEGPWVQWYEDMSLKTVIKKLAKHLPSSADIERVLDRDNAMFGVQQRTERSGAEAAKNLLSADPIAVEDDTPPPTRFDDDDALAAIAACTTLDTLKDQWAEIAADYFDSGRDIPVQLQGAFDDRMETLKQKAPQE